MFGNIKVITPTIGIFCQVYRKESEIVKPKDLIQIPTFRESIFCVTDLAVPS